jgi:hypothetical protein
LQSVFKGRAAIWIGKLLNLEIKSCPLISDYILMTFGMGLTILMQSSSVTTSTLTPLVGIGLIRIDKMFPFTIGANIGTTVTGILAALASSNMKVGLQVAMAHLLFNVLGTMMWFMVPLTRRVPLAMAKFLGDFASEVKAFPVFLIIFAWLLCPAALLFLSVAGVAVVAIIGGLVFAVVLALIAIVFMRSYFPSKVPGAFSGNPAWLPPVLCTASEYEARRQVWFKDPAALSAEATSVDAKAGAWWQSPLAWGSGWFVLMLLVVAVPNCAWANLKYPKFDGRDHIGIGAWQACSNMYEGDMAWAPPRTECTQTDLLNCASLSDCKTAGFSDTYGSNTAYEKSWVNCRTKCSIKVWESHCIGLQCSGGSHVDQCKNVTSEVHQNFEVTHKSSATPAWVAGDRCRNVADFCDSGIKDKLGEAGFLGWVGFAVGCVAQILLVGYGTMNAKSPNKLKVLLGSLFNFFLAWLFLLISWAIFVGTLSNKATCTVVDASATGAVVATGNFGDIIMGSGSYSFAFVLASWMMLTPVLFVIAHRVLYEVREKKKPKTITGQETQSSVAVAPTNGEPAETTEGPAPAPIPVQEEVEAAPKVVDEGQKEQDKGIINI